MKNRVFIIGLDGGDLGLLTRYARDLPNISELEEKGSSSRLRSTFIPLTPAAWASAFTGVQPHKHGIWDWSEEGGESKQLVSSLSIRIPSLWEYIKDLRIGLLNIPMTFPPSRVNGFMISGLLSPSLEKAVYPKNLSKDLRRLGYVISNKERFTNKNKRSYLEGLLGTVESRTRAALFLLSNYELDLFWIVYQGTDHAGHFFWKDMDENHPLHEPGSMYKDAIKKVYKKVDEGIGKILQYADENTTVILMSDHGMGPCHYVFHINSWLCQMGYQKSESDFRSFFQKIGVNPASLYRLGERFGFLRIFDALPRKYQNRLVHLFSDKDSSGTLAYSNGYYGQVRITDKTRHDKIEITNDLESRLRNLRTPNGKPLIDDFYSKIELYEDAPEMIPDILFTLTDESCLVSPFNADSNRVFSQVSFNWSGIHYRDGVLILSGHKVKNRAINPNIADIAPTVLYLLDRKTPTYMDGRVLTEAFEEDNPR